MRDLFQYYQHKLRITPFLIWSKVDDYCHSHSWVPKWLAQRVCDHFEYCIIRDGKRP